MALWKWVDKSGSVVASASMYMSVVGSYRKYKLQDRPWGHVCTHLLFLCKDLLGQRSSGACCLPEHEPPMLRGKGVPEESLTFDDRGSRTFSEWHNPHFKLSSTAFQIPTETLQCYSGVYQASHNVSWSLYHSMHCSLFSQAH